MDRRIKLLDLINAKFNGNQADFARAIGKSPAQINQWLAGVRNLGDGSVRQIEKKLKLGDYFDTPDNVTALKTQPDPLITELCPKSPSEQRPFESSFPSHIATIPHASLMHRMFSAVAYCPLAANCFASREYPDALMAASALSFSSVSFGIFHHP